MEKSSLQRTIYNPIIEKNVSGFLDNLDLENLRKNYTMGILKK